jgi:hypothetical protein
MKQAKMNEDKHRAALELTDKLVGFLTKQPPEVALVAMMYALVATITTFKRPQESAAEVCKELPRLVAMAERALADAKRPHRPR